jgi:hypothetical protein
MSESDTYLRNPKGVKGGKYGASEQDQEDFEQEKLIKQWLSKSGAGEFEYKHISRKGTARNTIDQRSIRLDAQVQDEPGSRTYADVIAGSDGRDLECRLDASEVDERPKTAADCLDENMDLFFDAIGASEETKIWAKKSIKSAESLRRLRSLMKEEKPFEISPINLELPRQWFSFRG